MGSTIGGAESMARADASASPVTAAERLINLVSALVATQVGLTKDDIRARVHGYEDADDDVNFDRMFSRDKETLRELGIPIVTREAVRGDEFFYRVDEDAYAMPPVDFTPAEVGVLSAARAMWDDASVAEVAARALTKAQAVGDITPAGGDVARTDGRVPAHMRVFDPGASFEPICLAISRHERISFRYSSVTSGTVKQRVVEPWRLVARGRAWYVLGYDVHRAQPRLFRLSRVCSDVSVDTDSTFVPPSLDVISAVANSAFPQATPTVAQVILAPGVGQLLRARGTDVRQLPDGFVDVTIPYTDADAMLDLVIPLGAGATVTAPSDLRNMLITRAAAARIAYAPPLVKPGKTKRAASPRRPKTVSDAPKRTRRPAEATPERVSRLLALVAYLGRNYSASMDELASHFGVTPAQIAQDVSLLWMTGKSQATEDLLDFSYDDYEQGVVTLSNAQQLDAPLRFTATEAMLLVIALNAMEQDIDSTTIGVVASTRHKIEQTLGKQAELANAVHVDVATTPRPVAAGVAEAAITQGNALTGTYVDARDRQTPRLVDPLRVFTDGDNWLLSAWDRERGAERTFRLDRFTDVASGGPAEHHMTSKWTTQGFSGRGTMAARVRFAPPARWAAERLDCQAMRELPGGGVQVDLVVADPLWLAAVAVAHAPHVDIVSPRQLRDEAYALAADICRVYDAVPE